MKKNVMLIKKEIRSRTVTEEKLLNIQRVNIFALIPQKLW
jgi:hypothetical protein